MIIKLWDKISLYHLIVIFLLSLYLLGAMKFGLAKVAWQAVPSILAATTADAVLRFIRLKKWTISPTALISGLIIGLVAQFGEQALTLAAIAMAAMIIKLLVKFDGRHIFNPAASGLFVGLILLSSHPSWWVGGENFWIYFIWIPILLYKMKRWAPMVGFLLPLIILNGINTLTSSSVLFFTSVMLIEPKTSPATVKLGLIYGVMAVVGYLIMARLFQFDPLILSLLIANLTARIVARYSNI